MRARIATLVAAALLAVSCDRGPLAERAGQRQRALGSTRLPPNVRPAPEPPARFGFGRAATGAAIAAWDIDVSPDGAGLPPGRGTSAQGATVYAAKCASCHGASGEGTPAGPRLVGRESAEGAAGFAFGRDPKRVKTIGNYWPYATTVFDYVRRTMPLTAPGSLTDPEVYSLVAFLLAENAVIERTAVMDSATLAAVKMPARDRFVPDDRRGGAEFK